MFDPMSDDRSELPSDLWTRLARLDHTCHVSVHSLYLDTGKARPERVWEVEIRCRATPSERPVTFRDPSMLRVIAAGVLEAERRGWGGSKDSG